MNVWKSTGKFAKDLPCIDAYYSVLCGTESFYVLHFLWKTFLRAFSSESQELPSFAS